MLITSEQVFVVIKNVSSAKEIMLPIKIGRSYTFLSGDV